MSRYCRLLVVVFIAVVTLSGLCGKPVPPDRPVIVAGPTQGGTGISYDFAAIAPSPEGDSVAIRFDWGDGDTSDWSGYVASDEEVRMSRIWSSFGTYRVRAQARAESGAESDWSGHHEVILRLKWRYRTGGEIWSSPAIAENGTIYIGSDDHYLYAFNPEGTLKWRYRTGGPLGTTPAVAVDGTVYVGSNMWEWPWYLYAVNPDGTLRWRYEHACESPAIAGDGTIYVLGGYGLSAIDSDGTLKWHYEPYGLDHGIPVVGPDGTVYLPTSSCGSEGRLCAINPDGTEKWCYEEYGFVPDLYSAGIDRDGTVYIGSDYHLYAINPDGTLKWQYRLDEYGYIDGSSPAIAADGSIYVGGSYGQLYAINPDGTLKWRYQAKDWFGCSSPAVATDGTIYIGSDAGFLYALKPDGSLKWRYQTGSEIGSSPAIAADGTVYLGGYDGYLYAIQGDAPLANSPWPKFRGDNRNTGRAGGGEESAPVISAAAVLDSMQPLADNVAGENR